MVTKDTERKRAPAIVVPLLVAGAIANAVGMVIALSKNEVVAAVLSLFACVLLSLIARRISIRNRKIKLG